MQQNDRTTELSPANEVRCTAAEGGWKDDRGRNVGRKGGGWGSGFRTAIGGIAPSRRRGCHFDDTPILSLLKHLLNVEGGAAERQSRALAGG